MNYFNWIESTFEKLNKVSPTFCLAKYDLFTIHLHLGVVHSCHLSVLSKIDVNDIVGPYDFFNHPEIKKARKEMKDGVKNEGCKYCWEIEKTTKHSDRHIQSSLIENRYEEIVKMDPIKDDIIPSYLEVSFSNLCNLKCSYCFPSFSSRWENDLNKHGDFKNPGGIQSKKHIPLIKNNNPFIEKFKMFFPDILKNLKFLRITGGEPLIQKELYEILDFIEKNPQPDLTLNINTNLCNNKVDYFIDKIKNIERNIKKIEIFVSCDSSGKHAEFIREGLNYSEWKNNCYKILNELESCNITIMCTLNNLCLTEEFKVFINDIYDMTQYSIGKRISRIYFNIQTLFHPIYQSIKIIDYDIFKDIIQEIEDLLISKELKFENGVIITKGFLRENIKKFKIIKNIIANSNENNDINKKNFVYFLDQCKIRNGKNYKDFFNDKNYLKFFERIQFKTANKYNIGIFL
jgi:organic radical activating enzyme